MSNSIFNKKYNYSSYKFSILYLFVFFFLFAAGTFANDLYPSNIQPNGGQYQVNSNIPITFDVCFNYDFQVFANEWNITVTIKDQNNTNVFSEVINGADGNGPSNCISFNTFAHFIPTEAGTYTLSIHVSYNQDIDNSNDIGTTTFTVIKPCPSGPAIGAFPGDSASVILDTGGAITLTWQNPGDQTLVSLYFSDDSAKVANKDNSVLAASGATLESFSAINLEINKTYFWCVTETCEENTLEAVLLRFITINPCGAAELISPAGGASIDGLNTTLEIRIDNQSVDSFYVYLSTDSSKVANKDESALYRAEKTNAFKTEYKYNFNSDLLKFGEKYYWCVVSKCNNGTNTSDLLSFFLENDCQTIFTEITPANGEINTEYNNFQLTWTVDPEASKKTLRFDVYFSEDSLKVINKDPSVKRPQIFYSTAKTYYVAYLQKLEPHKKYYWCVIALCIEKNDLFISYVGKSSPGLLNFTTRDCPGFTNNFIPHNAGENIGAKNVEFQWMNPEDATSCTLYLNSDSTLVAVKSPQALVKVFEPISDNYFVTDLNLNTTYYWCVAQKCGNENERSGPIWKFSTSALDCPGKADNPSPINKAVSVPVNLSQLTWSNPGDEESITILFSTDSSAVANKEASATLDVVNKGTTSSTIVVEPGKKYYWQIIEKCSVGDNPGPIWSFEVEAGATSVNKLDEIATEYSLEQNYPNPFNPTTMISFSIPETQFVTLKIYNILGKLVTVLLKGNRQAGKYEVEFNAGNLPSGLYVYELRTQNFTDIKKMLLIK